MLATRLLLAARRCVLSGISMAFTVGVQADDIDIYLENRQHNDAPRVQLTIDYHPDLFAPLCRYAQSCRPPFMTPAAYAALDNRETGAAVSRFEGLVAVLEALITDPVHAEVRLALLVSNGSGGGGKGPAGASLLSGYRRLGDQGSELLAVLKSIPPLTATTLGHKLQPGYALLEWYRYLNGGSVLHGTATEFNFGSGEPGHDLSVVSNDGHYYRPPFADTQSCSRLYSILVAMEPAVEAGDVMPLLRGEFGAAIGAGFTDFWRYLHVPDVDLVDAISGTQPLSRSWLLSGPQSRDWASGFNSPGSPVSVLDVTHPMSLQAGLAAALGDTVGASVMQGTPMVVPADGDKSDIEGSVLFSLFSPRATQRWPGNIKKLKMAYRADDEPGEILVGADDRPAGGGSLGRSIGFDAITWWTDAGTLPAGDGLRVPLYGDGAVVDRGGAGQQVPGHIQSRAGVIGEANSEPGARQVFLEPTAAATGDAPALQPLDATAANASALQEVLGALDRDHALSLLRWARGLDVDDENADGATGDSRPWLFGEVLHATAVPIHYGAVNGHSTANPLVRIAFGSGEGALHILENTDANGVESGAEVFAFYPRELLGQLRLRRENTSSSRGKRYGVDGPISVLRQDLNGDGTLDHRVGDRVYLYFGLRRGGSSYFALDISDPTTTPRLLWKITRTQGGDFDELGLTFSAPLVTRVRYGGEPLDVIIFAGGYNGGWTPAFDARVGKDAGAEDDDVGNALYIVEAATGKLIWKAVRGVTGSLSNTVYRHADLADSIPSDVTPLLTGSGIAHRLYVGDTGGALWRVDLPQGDGRDHRRDNWSISKLAQLGDGVGESDRRFFHPPELVESSDQQGAFDGVLIASGDRAHPGELDVANYLFYLKDRAVSSGDRSVRRRAPQRVTDLPDRADCQDQSSAPTECAQTLTAGWKRGLQTRGEKGLSTPLVDGGRIILSTFVPTISRSCRPAAGEGRLYQLNLADASAPADAPPPQTLGPGIPAGAIVMGNRIVLPAGTLTVPPVPRGHSPRVSIPRRSDQLHFIYWRQSGVDDT